VTRAKSEHNIDPGLFHRAKKDEAAFVELYRSYAPSVYGWFRRNTAVDADTAADLTAEVFARVVVRLGRFRGEHPRSGSAWIFTIVRNLAADYQRKRIVEDRARKRLGFRVALICPDVAEDFELLNAAEAASTEVRSAFESLTDLQQSVLSDRIVEELSYAEVASRRGISEQAARLHVMRGLRHLRKLVRPASHSELTRTPKEEA